MLDLAPLRGFASQEQSDQDVLRRFESIRKPAAEPRVAEVVEAGYAQPATDARFGEIGLMQKLMQRFESPRLHEAQGRSFGRHAHVAYHAGTLRRALALLF